jgi:tetratricopeptide (TPR) repeat protein
MKDIRIGERTQMKSISLSALLLLFMRGTSVAQTQTQSQDNSLRRQYTPAEYNAFVAADQETDPAKQVMLLDDFVSHYPKSALLSYVYPLYVRGYMQLRDFSKVIGYADKLAELGDKVDVSTRYLALYTAANAYNNMKSNDPKLATGARERALTGLKVLLDLKKPDILDVQVFEALKRKQAIYFQATAGAAAMAMKDYPAATESFNAVIALDSVPQIFEARCNF